MPEDRWVHSHSLVLSALAIAWRKIAGRWGQHAGSGAMIGTAMIAASRIAAAMTVKREGNQIKLGSKEMRGKGRGLTLWLSTYSLGSEGEVGR